MRRIFTMFKQSIQMSLKNIVGNKMRSFLTMLGIIIGVAAVIALITTVSGVTQYIMNEFYSLGAGSLTVTASGNDLQEGLTESNLEEIAELDNVEAVSPSISVSTKVVRNSYISSKVSVTGRNGSYFIHNSDMITYGRALLPSDMDGSVMVCVIDSTCAETFFLGEDPVGQYIKIGGIQYKVVGICGEDDNLMSSFMGGDSSEGTIYIPYKNAMRMNSTNCVTSIEVYMEDTNQSETLSDNLEALLKSIFNNDEDAYSIVDMQSMLEMMETVETMLTSLLAGIASISLLVGGIGIMNMMLVSVTERTKEIGLRKALGAQPGIIQMQFLIESVFLSAFGGLIGIVTGELIAFAAMKVIGTEFTVNVFAIALGAGFSLGVGIIFGWAPARNASRLNPIDALRSE